MEITYIHHSCFSLEFDNLVLLFDYYKGTIPKFDINKPLIVFSSHKHYDHFDLSIFNLIHEHPYITFILSKDTKMTDSFMNRHNVPEEVKNKIHYMNKNETFVVTNLPVSLTIETLESTDEGVAFIVRCNDKTIYHAGDLNWWSWIGESKEEYEDMTSRFMKEMDKLKDEHIDIAFVPLDPRQEDRFWWGFDHFMKTTDTKIAFPMHFWMDYSIIHKMKNLEQAKEYADRIIDISEEGQKLIL